MSNQNTNLPTLADLTQDVDKAYKGDELNLLLNQPPPEKWIKNHPFIKMQVESGGGKITVPYKYLPIDKIEALLKRIFRRYRIEITGQGSSFNGVWVTARVHFWNLVWNDWDFHDGIGAVQMQTKRGSSPADLANINNGALAMAYPAAYTYAIKNACAKFGKLFGSDLNREDAVPFMPEKSTGDKIRERVEFMVDKAETIEDLESLKQDSNVPAKYHDLIEAKIEYLKNKEGHEAA